MTDDSYELVLPFQCVESTGGPYNDEAFVAGVQIGRIYGAAEHGPRRIQAMVYSPTVSTVDLVAMKYGYQLETVEHDEWVEVILTRVPAT